MGPKDDIKHERGTRYHAKEVLKPDAGFEWAFEEKPTSMMPTQRILVRLVIAKIEDTDGLAKLLRQIPIRPEQEGWNCVLWVKDALTYLERSKSILGRSVIEWETVRRAAMSYCQQKIDQHRFDGKGKFDISRVPTFDLIQQKETIA